MAPVFCLPPRLPAALSSLPERGDSSRGASDRHQDVVEGFAVEDWDTTPFRGKSQGDPQERALVIGPSRTRRRKPIGLGVWVSVASPARWSAARRVPVAIPTDSVT
jgi:hypothetical protein